MRQRSDARPQAAHRAFAGGGAAAIDPALPTGTLAAGRRLAPAPAPAPLQRPGLVRVASIAVGDFCTAARSRPPRRQVGRVLRTRPRAGHDDGGLDIELVGVLLLPAALRRAAAGAAGDPVAGAFGRCWLRQTTSAVTPSGCGTADGRTGRGGHRLRLLGHLLAGARAGETSYRGAVGDSTSTQKEPSSSRPSINHRAVLLACRRAPALIERHRSGTRPWRWTCGAGGGAGARAPVRAAGTRWWCWVGRRDRCDRSRCTVVLRRCGRRGYGPAVLRGRGRLDQLHCAAMALNRACTRPPAVVGLQLRATRAGLRRPDDLVRLDRRLAFFDDQPAGASPGLNVPRPRIIRRC